METYAFMKTMGERTNRSRQIYSDWAKSKGVNYNVMAVLYTAYHNANCSQKFICEEWCVPKQTVNTVCRDLTEEGIIEQVRNADDKRGKCICLTNKGKEYADTLVGELLDIENRIMSRMGRSADEFFDLYVKYIDCVEAEFAKR